MCKLQRPAGALIECTNKLKVGSNYSVAKLCAPNSCAAHRARFICWPLALSELTFFNDSQCRIPPAPLSKQVAVSKMSKVGRRALPGVGRSLALPKGFRPHVTLRDLTLINFSRWETRGGETLLAPSPPYWKRDYGLKSPSDGLGGGFDVEKRSRGIRKIARI